MNRDKNGRFTKELVVGDKITSFDQLKEGMIVDFRANGVNVKNAILVFDDVYNWWCAVHNNPKANGNNPLGKVNTYGMLYSWLIGTNFRLHIDVSDMIFRGWYKKEEVKPEVKNPYKIGDFVKSCAYDKSEVIGICGDYVWLRLMAMDGSKEIFFTLNCIYVSPCIEPLKYKKGDLVLVKDGNLVCEIVEVKTNKYVLKSINGMLLSDCTDNDIVRKIGVVDLNS